MYNRISPIHHNTHLKAQPPQQEHLFYEVGHRVTGYMYARFEFNKYSWSYLSLHEDQNKKPARAKKQLAHTTNTG